MIAPNFNFKPNFLILSILHPLLSKDHVPINTLFLYMLSFR
jgi:hypothetical protein